MKHTIPAYFSSTMAASHVIFARSQQRKDWSPQGQDCGGAATLTRPSPASGAPSCEGRHDRIFLSDGAGRLGDALLKQRKMKEAAEQLGVPIRSAWTTQRLYTLIGPGALHHWREHSVDGGAK